MTDDPHCSPARTIIAREQDALRRSFRFNRKRAIAMAEEAAKKVEQRVEKIAPFPAHD